MTAEYYALSSGQLTQRVLHPYKLLDRAGTLYLVGYCELRGGIRSFHTGRFRSVSARDELFEWPEDVPSSTLIEGGAGEEALIHFDSSIVQRIVDIFEPEVYQRTEDGGVLVRLKLVSQRWIISWLMSLGPTFEVLAPRSLRAELARLH